MKADAIIIGAGIIGMTLALALSRSNKKVIILEKNLLASMKINRVYSISEKTKSFFEELELWKEIEEINNLDHMNIYYRNFKPSNLLRFSEKNSKSSIGYIAQSKNISIALLKKLESDDNIQILDNHEVRNIEEFEEKIKVEINNKKSIEGKYLFSCEGSNSIIKKKLEINNMYDNYNSKALVFNIEHKIDNKNTAYQVFLKSGPVAFLPISKNHFSMVVTVKNKFLEKKFFEKDNIKEFIKNITNNIFGEIKLTSDIISFDLVGFDSEKYKVKNIIFVGDSAHSVHPLAGMGLNLGVSDIIEIIDAINNKSLSFDARNIFSHYARKQKIVNRIARQQLKLIEAAYSIENKLVGKIVKSTMRGIQRSDFIKEKIIKHANNNLSFF